VWWERLEVEWTPWAETWGPEREMQDLELWKTGTESEGTAYCVLFPGFCFSCFEEFECLLACVSQG
jgi:hypothetical protein